MNNLPTEPGYYWAKLKTPSGGVLYGCTPEPIEVEANDDWASVDWELVEVNENDPYGDPKDPEHFSVCVYGIPLTQWPLDFFWGPKVDVNRPSV